MASPTTATRQWVLAWRSATSRSRESAKGMGPEGSRGARAGSTERSVRPGRGWIEAADRDLQWLSPAQALPLPSKSGVLSKTPTASRLPALVTRVNEAAKSKVLALQEYFALAWN